MNRRIACLWPTLEQRDHFYSVMDKAAILRDAGYDVWLGLEDRAAELYRGTLDENGVPWMSDVETACHLLRETTAVVGVALGSRARRGDTLFPHWPREIFRAFMEVPIRVSLLETPHHWGQPRADVVRRTCNAAFCSSEEDMVYWQSEQGGFSSWPLAWGSALYEPFWTNLPPRDEARLRFALPEGALVACCPHRLMPSETPRAVIAAVREAGIHVLAPAQAGGRRVGKALWEFDPTTRGDPLFHFLPWQPDPRPMVAASDFGIVMGAEPYINIRGFDWMLLLGNKPLIAHVAKRASAIGRDLEVSGAGVLVHGTVAELIAAFEAIAAAPDVFEFGKKWNDYQTEQYLELIKQCMVRAEAMIIDAACGEAEPPAEAEAIRDAG